MVVHDDQPVDGYADTTIVVGWTYVGNLCHIPVIVAGVAGVACRALVDTGSNATLI